MQKGFRLLGMALLLATTALAQSDKHFTESFSSLRFDAFVQKIEATSAYHFYYNEKALDSFTVNVNASNNTLPELLQQLFQNTIYL